MPTNRRRLLERYDRLDHQTRATLAGFSTAGQAVIARFLEDSLRDTQALLDVDT